ncbi:MAG: DUF1707 SHOCT-like domain-containing protein [Janthinobacterium lividum]
MTDQLPGRTPPWSTGVWISPAHPQAQPVRIGDAERDTALDKLADHFAAGRLTRDELDERTEKAMGARFDSDLEPLFRDLPGGLRDDVALRVRPRGSSGLPAVVGVLVPLLALAVVVVASIVLHGGPVLIAPVVWLLLLSGAGRRHRYR